MLVIFVITGNFELRKLIILHYVDYSVTSC